MVEGDLLTWGWPDHHGTRLYIDYFYVALFYNLERKTRSDRLAGQIHKLTRSEVFSEEVLDSLVVSVSQIKNRALHAIDIGKWPFDKLNSSEKSSMLDRTEVFYGKVSETLSRNRKA